ncbi:MAG: FIST N-terminal domain-containing protein [Kofleriaceae bacterium]
MSAPRSTPLCRQATASGASSEAVADALASQLAGSQAALVLAFADHRLDLRHLGAVLERTVEAPFVGGATTGVISSHARWPRGPGGDPQPEPEPRAVAVALSRAWFRVGLGVARDLGHNAVASARAATHQAACSLKIAPALLDPARHVALSLFDGRCGQEESFCVGSAGAAPQLRFVGGVPWAPAGAANLVVGSEGLRDAGVVVVLESARAFRTVSSVHVEPSPVRCVVTQSHGRRILELDGFPAASRYRKLLAELGAPELPIEQLFARYPLAMYLRGTPYIRSIRAAHGEVLEVTSAISSGQVLRLMCAADLVGATAKDFALAEQALGSIELLLAFSCISRRRDAASRLLEASMAALDARYPVVGFDSHGEQTGMVLVNHTLSGLAIGGI